jgi:hypothetical protein
MARRAALPEMSQGLEKKSPGKEKTGKRKGPEAINLQAFPNFRTSV